MVRALLEGRKTQTRRVAKLINSLAEGHEEVRVAKRPDSAGVVPMSRKAKHTPTIREQFLITCPYGGPGDRLWVKETRWVEGGYVASDWMPEELTKKRPAIHMPRFASRITLQITGVRVERVESITEEDAKAEGFRYDGFGESNGTRTVAGSFLRAFYDLNQRAPRGSNPWVWVLDFKVLEVRR